MTRRITMRRILLATAVIATLVSPVRAQSYGMPSGQGSTAPRDPNITQVRPASDMRLLNPAGSSGEAWPDQSQYPPLSQSQLNAIVSKSNQTQKGPARPEGSLR